MKRKNPERCFSRSGWWQTLCGLDAANQGLGWSDRKEHVGCEDCLALIAKGEHRRWRGRHILVSMRHPWDRPDVLAVYRRVRDGVPA